ncbi:GNAT family N-acetyltransferase [Chthonobacter albigriseus]|uniref:GNAT family N-acetyltransferase n=1 Tax=Chthonobacter albigriseus TaxID=1683161 RepID=UPI0015EF55F8|nr:GNAT family N-acetyltransferase [Chthonobacter albigriseus]
MSLRAIRPLSLGELETLIDWAAAEGWNPGLHDARCFFAADAEGFLGGFDASGALCAGISIVRYDDRQAFLGLYICRPDMRGRGYGYALWEAAIAHAGERSIGLDGVVAQQDNYRRSGFTYIHRNIRYTGRARLEPAHAALPERPAHRLRGIRSTLHPATAADVDDLLAYDAALFGAARPAFLRCWLSAPGHHAELIRGPQNEICGYAVIRPCRDGYKIGPLFADTPGKAQRLAAALLARIPGQSVSLDCPEPNNAAAALAVALGLSPAFETARMVKGRASAIGLARVFGITTFELG